MAAAPLDILIQTEFRDLHALLVATALQQRGHRVTRVLGNDLPTRSSVAFHYADCASECAFHTEGGTLHLDGVDVVWNRRPQGPVLPALLDEGDRDFAWTQNLLAQRAVAALLEDAFWANPQAAVRQAALKPLQLRHAPAAGLAIPPTLISNDPEAIRAFLRHHPQVIHKPLAGHIWHEGGRELGSYTARVGVDDLPPDPLLRAVPAILQVQVQKQYEVRAQFFGDSCFALRIESQQIEYGEFDWRMHQHGGAMSTAIELPPAVHRACRALMQRLGLVAGAFDFIVTPEDEWVFLEVNEAGQFLFLEIWCPQLTVIDACCAFLESRDAGFRYRQPSAPVRFADLSAQHPFEQQLEREREERLAAAAAEADAVTAAAGASMRQPQDRAT